jgi:iron complex transport system substrate-binding protein
MDWIAGEAFHLAYKDISVNTHLRLRTVLLSFLLFLFIASPALAGWTVTDMVGRKVFIPKKAERIVTTFKPSTLSVYCLGLADHLVGVDNECRYEPFTTGVYPPIAEVAGVGTKSTGLNIETIVALKPDLVVMYAQKDGIALADRLVGLGIPTIVILPEDFAKLDQTLLLIGQAAGIEDHARMVVDLCHDIVADVQKRVASIPHNQRKRCYYAGSRGFFSTASGDMLQSEIFVKAGGINVSQAFTGYFKRISPEQFISWNPDFVAVTGSGKKSLTGVLTRKELQGVAAIAHKQVYIFPTDIAPWDFPSPLSTLGVVWCATRLYPDRFSKSELEQRINHFYMTLFGKTLTDLGGSLGDRVFPQ